MDDRLEKTGQHSVSSAEGLVVEIQRLGGVLYRDPGGEVIIGTSWLGKPPGISLHSGTLRAKGLDQPRIDLIMHRAAGFACTQRRNTGRASEVLNCGCIRTTETWNGKVGR